ncbi:MAG TPA: hypothetical protein VGN16_14310 [Acidobacteriaceae bacterium]|jgi:hypothetical protein
MQEGNAAAVAMRPGPDYNLTNSHGVSWAAVFAGALTAAALYLILLALGAGFGLSSVSPWSGVGLHPSALGASAIVWLIVTEILSSAMGGYLAGRLRSRWIGIHSDEVHFRDTAHGFLAWSTALVFTAAFLASAATALLGHSVSSKSTEVSPSSSQAAGPESYFVDKLFRNAGAKSEGAASSRAEAKIILGKALAQGSLASDDKAYLDQMVATQTGITPVEADGRVSSVFTDAQQAEDTTRKVVAHGLLWMFIALLLGAFTASLSATVGGRQRDQVVLT